MSISARKSTLYSFMSIWYCGQGRNYVARMCSKVQPSISIFWILCNANISQPDGQAGKSPRVNIPWGVLRAYFYVNRSSVRLALDSAVDTDINIYTNYAHIVPGWKWVENKQIRKLHMAVSDCFIPITTTPPTHYQI